MRTPTPLTQRILKNVVVNDDGCWEWQLSLDKDGYGKIHHAKVATRAHRAAYIAFVGPIPDGLETDHLCRVRHCCNPAHMEVVTHRENTLRGTSPSALCARKTHCPKGHAYDPQNTRLDDRNRRNCRACQRIAARAYRERKRNSPKAERVAA